MMMTRWLLTALRNRKAHRRWVAAIASLGCIVALQAFPAAAQTLSESILAMEAGLEAEFETYFGRELAEVTQDPAAIAATLARLSAETGQETAVLWAIPRGDHLHLVLITPDGEPLVRDLYEVSDDVLVATLDLFYIELYQSATYQTPLAARQLYDWILGPYVEAGVLEAAGIETILFCLGDGLRSLPLAALHDGEEYLIEQYSLSQIPAFNLIQTDHQALEPGAIVAMGASEFVEQSPLPAVPMELERVRSELEANQWAGVTALNQDFTRDRLARSMTEQQPSIVHLATHAFFQPGVPEESYIQLWDTALTLEDMAEMPWPRETLELLVLSACQTAVGDRQAELGFAGIALQMGVKSALASLWEVSDEGTLVLMSEFYNQLGAAPTKAEALRQAQLRMLRGEVGIQDQALILSRGSIPLPSQLATQFEEEGKTNFTAPIYWAGFTLISSPW